ncbi:interleukin-17 receptor A [Eublepharis macularius]|uniref:Interleukin-17 receptor A n=1 Tax=Eublepharis macularius TaxID=481883 RepID=A0AA97L9V5_EUBMA|nr:interleukin-17 receptor A [Eublepharis macularius]
MRGAAVSLGCVLLWGLASGCSGLRLLNTLPPFNCSQRGLHCIVRNSVCMDKSWLSVPPWTPSAPRSLEVHADVLSEGGKLLPVLNMEWMVATDGSILHLRGVELSVLQVTSNQQICVKFDFQNNLTRQVRPSDGRRWNFSFNHFVVQPGQSYQVTVHHLPKLATDGDQNCISQSYTVPGCMDPAMKMTAPCQQIGSLWEPNIEGTSLGDDSVMVSFSPTHNSTSYRIHVTSFQDEKECKTSTKEILEEGLHQQLNITVEIEGNLRACCAYRVQIQPFFEACGTDCLRHFASIPCPLLPFQSTMSDIIMDNTDTSMWISWCSTLVCFLIVGSIVAWVFCHARRYKGPHSGMSNNDDAHHGLLRLSQPAPLLKPSKVWIVYSADHKLYVDVVMKFAEFMFTVCGTEVILDLLEEHEISKMGAIRWLTRQKQEMEARSFKIIILCSRGTRAKWQAMLRHEEVSVSLRQDNRLPMGDMFTPALNLILPDFKQPACFGTYLVCYFEGISNEKDIPDPFNVTSKYQLMDKFEEVYFLIQDLEKFEPGRVHQIPEISAERYTESPSGQKLKEAVQKFKEWQAEHPDWFERENAGCGEEGDLQSLNGELCEDLTLLEGGILKQQLFLQEPDPNSCCQVNLCIKEDELGTCQLLPQLLPQEDPAFQTLIIPADNETSQVQVVEPVALAEEREIFSHQLLTNEDWLEGDPILEMSMPRRHSVVLQEELSSNAQPLPADVRQQLEGLMLSLYHQSLGLSEAPVCQEVVNEQQQPLVFEELCKDQRQSVQSDQGYISRSSPLPSDGPVEEEEEKDQDQESHRDAEFVSPDILDSLKSLQQQLLFQDIQQNSSRSGKGGVMGVL